jgi:hypothetical protein
LIHNLNKNYKKELFDNGYLVFQLDEDFKKELASFRDKLDYTSQLYESYNRKILGDLCINGMKTSGDLFELDLLRKSLLRGNHFITQMWYTIYQDSMMPDDYYTKQFQEILDFFYGKGIWFGGMVPGDYLLYSEGCRFSFHKDGGYSDTSEAVCTILVYLDEDWQDGYGGEIVVKTKDGEIITVPPTLGTCVMLELTKNDLEHRVNPVVREGYIRQNLRTIVNRKLDE